MTVKSETRSRSSTAVHVPGGERRNGWRSAAGAEAKDRPRPRTRHPRLSQRRSPERPRRGGETASSKRKAAASEDGSRTSRGMKVADLKEELDQEGDCFSPDQRPEVLEPDCPETQRIRGESRRDGSRIEPWRPARTSPVHTTGPRRQKGEVGGGVCTSPSSFVTARLETTRWRTVQAPCAPSAASAFSPPMALERPRANRPSSPSLLTSPPPPAPDPNLGEDRVCPSRQPPAKPSSVLAILRHRPSS